jgi:hypothetical protein
MAKEKISLGGGEMSNPLESTTVGCVSENAQLEQKEKLEPKDAGHNICRHLW